MPDARRLVLVMGPGRSGTSTMAGALALSGHAVPDPIGADETNPAGFHEPQWVVDLHTRLLERVGVRTLDTDPAAFERLAAVTGDADVRAEVAGWLDRSLSEHHRLVVKDPRLVWFRDLWVEAARGLGVEPAFVVMLRHPAEVASSRQAYYDVREVTAVAGWVNVALLAEALTADSPRAIVSYPRLTADWRPALADLRDRLGVHVDPAPDVRPHPVDGFVDAGLRRMSPSWEGSVAPAHLRALAARVHTALDVLAGQPDAPRDDVEALAGEYARLHADALAVTVPHAARVREDVRRRTARRVRAELGGPGEQDGTGGGSGEAPRPGLARRAVRRLRPDASGGAS